MALVPLFYKTAKDAPKITAFHFYLCAHIFHTLLLQWLIANLFWAGGWAIIGQQLLCVALSLFWAVLGWGWGMARSRNSRYAGAWCMAGLWCLMELLQARMFTGFGWSALGYAQGGNLWVAQWAAVGGVTLISFLLVGVNALLALGLREAESRFVRLLAAVVVVGMAHGAGVLLLKEADYATRPLNAGIVQPNFSQEMKWDGAYDVDMLQRTAQLTRALSSRYNPDITVWPEALIVRHFESPEVMEVLSSLTQETQSYLFTGAVRNDYATSKSFNSSALMGPDGKLRGYYDKVRLAAFGEYIPFEHYLPFLGQIAFGGVDAGQEQRVLSVKDRNLGPLICFEVLFAPMAEALRAKGADMLAVVTNLAWFGGANAIPQELEIARMRAIETRLPLLHSANTGISGVFDPYGRFHVVRQTVHSWAN
jgi:apolipoprotein N-acyltransferase